MAVPGFQALMVLRAVGRVEASKRGNLRGHVTNTYTRISENLEECLPSGRQCTFEET